MSFIRTQKVVRDASGRILSGSAAILESVYGNYGNHHSKQKVIERLGKVLYLSEDKKSGIFRSPTRGLVEYSSLSGEFREVSEDDPRITGTGHAPQPQVHTVFGDVYFLMSFLDRTGMTGVLQQAFPDPLQYERLMCHLCHGVLKDGSHISCGNFTRKSFASSLFSSIPVDSLNGDTTFFGFMGSEDTKLSFFAAFHGFLRAQHPDSGKAIYVDLKALPGDIIRNPFQALRRPGAGEAGGMMRLVVLLDEETGLPVWFDTIPGSELDVCTLERTAQNIPEDLHAEISGFVLDARYLSEELITYLCSASAEKPFVAQMPAKKEFPYQECYREAKDQFGQGRYTFLMDGKPYFGMRLEKSLFGVRCFVYAYVDRARAMKEFSEYLEDHEDEFQAMPEENQDWLTVRGGFFLLVSNQEKTPKDMLREYTDQTHHESVFKAETDYAQLLPLSEWTDTTVRGKLLYDMIVDIILRLLRKEFTEREQGLTLSSLIGKCASLMCCTHPDGRVLVETPSREVREIFNLAGLKVPSFLKLADCRSWISGK